MLARGQGTKNLAGRLLRADEQQVKGRVGLAGAQSAVNHDGGSMVPAEEVDGDPRGARLPDSCLSGSRSADWSPQRRCDPPGDRARHLSATQTSRT
ncbi:hypothetical protein Abr02nite_07080 [Paractinoplanes brasiliensis]|nr:hypothetical protein Abr02nite_07080 [Actinoplanes brasiliensis]